MNYSKNKIFTDSTINAVVDRIYYELAKGCPEIKLDDTLALTGAAAAILQEAQTGNCKNVMLITNSEVLYAYIQNELPKRIYQNGVLKFKERTIFYFGELALELWYKNDNLGIVRVSEVHVQSYAKIDPICL